MDIRRWIITGERGSGKTLYCKELIRLVRLDGLDAAGILSPAHFKNGIKESISAESVRDGESRMLAHIKEQIPSDLHFGDWYFNRETLAWGNRVIRSSIPCDLLVIDELGPLEFNLKVGWLEALEVLEKGGYHQAVVVVRPELLEKALAILPSAETIRVTGVNSVRESANDFPGRKNFLRGSI